MPCLSRELFFLIQKIRSIKPIDDLTGSFDPSANALILELERKISTPQFDMSPNADDEGDRLDAGTRLDLLTLAEA
ncbi:hypothetical protein Brms1b_010650 [Colletotrichum noveboracense]|nr:hypothetical protein Brms1b_010650 [Colletotrichum noveboracense]